MAMRFGASLGPFFVSFGGAASRSAGSLSGAFSGPPILIAVYLVATVLAFFVHPILGWLVFLSPAFVVVGAIAAVIIEDVQLTRQMRLDAEEAAHPELIPQGTHICPMCGSEFTVALSRPFLRSVNWNCPPCEAYIKGNPHVRAVVKAADAEVLADLNDDFWRARRRLPTTHMA